jgi:hypothetical protein
MKIIISENQVDKIKSKIHEYVKKYGIEKCREIFGDKVLFTIGFNNDPMEFLNLFNDLDVVQSAEKENWTLFRYEKGKNLMIYDRKNDYVYINYKQIWSVLREDFGLNYDETKQLTKEWVGVAYNLRGVTTILTDRKELFSGGSSL